MLRAEDNQFLTESSAATGMSELLRRFWLPVLQAGDGVRPRIATGRGGQDEAAG